MGMSEEEVPEEGGGALVPRKHSILSKHHRALAMKRIIAGDTNEQIRNILRREGQHDVSDAVLGKLRNSEKVQKALDRFEGECVQIGLALRGRRIVELVGYANELKQRMSGKVPGEPDLPGVPIPAMGLVTLGREFREALRDIGKLVDAPEPRQVFAQVRQIADERAPAAKQKHDMEAQLLAAFNDTLELMIEEEERNLPIDAEFEAES